MTQRISKDELIVGVAELNDPAVFRGIAFSDATFAPSFYSRGGKRMFDTFASAIALLLLSPLFVLISLLIKLTSPGPVFFLQQRVGLQGRLFRIVKFRSMGVGAEKQGSAITAVGDLRVTPLGRVLRFLKIDELPQLWNVLKGEMSLVGPRPELPRYVQCYTESQLRILDVRPGMTDPASIKYAREEDELRESAAPERFYVDVILPDKLDLNLEYIKRVSFFRDLSLLSKTVIAIVFHTAFRNYHLRKQNA
jgi:lipopolysaccharide/colanic/teichoic acid biosynthesis glycosyltransferase